MDSLAELARPWGEGGEQNNRLSGNGRAASLADA